jgi:hypothetical protein
MTTAQRRWIMPVLRYGLLVAALVWLAGRVPWHDSVHLRDKDRVRLIEQRPDGFVVERHGQRETLTPEQVLYEADQVGRQVPVIELGIVSVALRVNKTWTLWAILIFVPAVLIQSYRLAVMVAAQNLRLAFWDAIKLTFAGNFFNLFLPGTTGGDVVKAYYITHYTHRKTEVVTIVFIDRIIGLIGMVLLAAGGIAALWRPGRFNREVLALAIILAGLAIATVVVFNRRVRRKLHLSELVTRLPKAHHLLRVGQATVGLWDHKVRLTASLALTLVLQSLVMVSAAVMAWALHMQPGPSFGGLAYYFAYVSIGFLIACIPSTPQAFGVMEAAYVTCFTQGGLNDASQAVALALGVRMIQFVWALPGGLVALLGAHLPRKAELAALEATAAENDGPPGTPEAGAGEAASAAHGAATPAPTRK